MRTRPDWSIGSDRYRAILVQRVAPFVVAPSDLNACPDTSCLRSIGKQMGLVLQSPMSPRERPSPGWVLIHRPPDGESTGESGEIPATSYRSPGAGAAIGPGWSRLTSGALL